MSQDTPPPPIWPWGGELRPPTHTSVPSCMKPQGWVEHFQMSCGWRRPGAAHMPWQGLRHSDRSMCSFHAHPVRWVPWAPLYTQGR